MNKLRKRKVPQIFDKSETRRPETSNMWLVFESKGIELTAAETVAPNRLDSRRDADKPEFTRFKSSWRDCNNCKRVSLAHDGISNEKRKGARASSDRVGVRE
jgi:hypothetical protein